jgi:cysteine synthase A
VHPLEPANSPTLRTGRREGVHRIQGISDEFIPEILELAALDRVVDVWDGDAILMAQRLSRELGLAFGISSGANLLGAIEIALEQGPGAVVATVFPDCNRKYLSGPLGGIEPPRPEYVTPGVELRGFERIRG